MKALYAFFLLSFTLIITSCSENELEGVQANNPYDVEEADYVSMTNIRKQSCEVILIDLVINEHSIPKGIEYSHVIIENESNNRSRLVSQYNDIYLKIPCNQSVKFSLYLFNKTLNQRSAASVYTYQL